MNKKQLLLALVCGLFAGSTTQAATVSVEVPTEIRELALSDLVAWVAYTCEKVCCDGKEPFVSATRLYYHPAEAQLYTINPQRKELCYPITLHPTNAKNDTTGEEKTCLLRAHKHPRLPDDIRPMPAPTSEEVVDAVIRSKTPIGIQTFIGGDALMTPLLQLMTASHEQYNTALIDAVRLSMLNDAEREAFNKREAERATE